MLKKIAYTSVIISVLILSGCASNAEISQMTASTTHAKYPKDKSLTHNINVDNISGGHETNPLWTSQINNANFKAALEQSLSQTNLLGEQSSNYSLNAELLRLDQPFIGINLKVLCKVHYQLIIKKTKKLIYNDDIETSYTATFSDSPLAVIRLKMANEGAARANIQKLIDEVYHLSST